MVTTPHNLTPDSLGEKARDAECLHVIVEHSAGNTHENVLHAGINAFIAYVLTLGSGKSNERSDFLAWSTPEMRKVVRRARGARWSDIMHLEPATSHLESASSPRVAVLPPTRISDTPVAVKRLQVAGTDYPRGGFPDITEPDIVLSINPTLELSTGKALAQVLHAMHRVILAVLFEDEAQPELINGIADRVTKLKSKPLQEWKVAISDSLFEDWDFMVVDSGFTEIEPGSITVLGKITQ